MMSKIIKRYVLYITIPELNNDCELFRPSIITTATKIFFILEINDACPNNKISQAFIDV